MTLDAHSWGYRRNARASDYLPLSELLGELVSTIAFGGNLLVNVGPAADGSIPVIMEERLLGMGSWLSVNGEGVYSTIPWRVQNETAAHTYFTATKAPNTPVFAHFGKWPLANTLSLKTPVASGSMSAQLLVQGGYLPANVSGTPGQPGVTITLWVFYVEKHPNWSAFSQFLTTSPYLTRNQAYVLP